MFLIHSPTSQAHEYYIVILSIGLSKYYQSRWKISVFYLINISKANNSQLM